MEDNPTNPYIERWKNAVRRDFPELSSTSYFVPSVYIFQTKHEKMERPGKSVYVAVPFPPESKHFTQNDLAQQIVIRSFQYLAEKQIMFVLSELHFQKYLIKMSPPKNKSHTLPRFCDQPLKDMKASKGDFDILVIHERLGVMAAELKSVGYDFENAELNTKQKEAIRKKIGDAMIQMKKFRDGINHILPDLELNGLLKIALLLPYVSRLQLQTILTEDENGVVLREELCKHLGISPDQDPSDYCLLSDDVPSKSTPWQLTEDVKEALDVWWGRVMEQRGGDTAMTQERYEDLVARFCGPATEVELRTLGQGVSRMGDEFLRVCLTPEQVNILNENEPYVELTGPPGTGKTLLLIQKSKEWLNDDDLNDLQVYVVSVETPAMAAGEMIFEELREDFDGRVHRLHADTEDERTNVLEMLQAAAEHGRIGVVMDEFDYFEIDQQIGVGAAPSSVPEAFVDTLMESEEKPDRFWIGSGIFHQSFGAIFEERKLTRSLRTPPVITREVTRCGLPDDLEYSDFQLNRDPPPASDGTQIIALVHRSGSRGHDGQRPAVCGQCWRDVGTLLRMKLQVGSRAVESTSTGKKGAVKKEPTLCYSDIFILGDGPEIYQSPDCLEAQEQADFPSMHVRSGDRKTIKQITRKERPDRVVISEGDTVRGQERKVVVWIEYDMDNASLFRARLLTFSRSTAQVVVVTTPETAEKEMWTVWTPPE